MSTYYPDCPEWAIKRYPGVRLEKWKRQKQVGKILIVVSMFLAFGPFILPILFINTIRETATGNGNTLQWLFILSVAIGLVILYFGIKLSQSGDELRNCFERDWSELKQKLSSHTTQPESLLYTEIASKELLISDAVKVRMAEIDLDSIEVALRKKRLVEDYLLLMKFWLVPSVPEPDKIETLPLKPYFDAAEPKVAEKLAFMVTRFECQKKGLAI